VRAFFLVSLLVGFSSEAVDRLWTAHVLKEFRLPSVLGVDDPAAWFAAFAMTGTAISLGVSLLANRMAAETINHLHPNRLLAGLTLVHVGGILVLALSGSLWLALGGLWVRESARSLAYPVEAAWLNRNVDSASRATVLSMNGQADAVGQVFGGPPLGALATRAGIPVALTVSALLLVPAAAVFARLRRSTVEAHAA
jgi:DHA3 family tetracycline resistance protein-like MFS transporter